MFINSVPATTSTDLLDGPQYIIFGLMTVEDSSFSASSVMPEADLFLCTNRQASLAPVTVLPVPVFYMKLS